jgi:hypothetical protein
LKLLKGRKKEVPFRALKLPDSIDWLEPELMRGKTLEDAELRANTAGMCGLSALTCLETSALMPTRSILYASLSRPWPTLPRRMWRL